MSSSDYATKQDLQNLHVDMKRDMRNEMAVLRVDMRNDMKMMFDDVLTVLGDMLTHIDKRFNKLEAVVLKDQDENPWH